MKQHFFRRLYKHPLLLVLLTAAVTIPAAVFISFIVIDNDVNSFIPKNEAAYIANETLNRTYGDSDLVLIGIERQYGTLTDPAMLARIAELSDALQEIPHVEEVISLTNAVVFSSYEQGIGSEPIFVDIPDNAEEIQKRLEYLNEWESTRGTFLSPSQQAAQIFVSIEAELSTQERDVLYDDLVKASDVLRQMEDVELHITGESILNTIIGKNMIEDVSLLLPLVIVVMTGLLAMFFRRMGGVLFPLITVAISVVWALGLMALLSRPLTLIGSVIPVILVAVGSAYGIHYVHAYYQQMDKKRSGQDAVFGALRNVGLPIVLAALTTLIGFSALSITKLAPMRDFGIFTAVGVVFAVVVLLMLAPAIHLLRARGEQKSQKILQSHFLKRVSFSIFFPNLYNVILKEKFLVLFASVILFVAAFFGIRKIVVNNNVIEYFPEQSEITQASEFFSEEFQGVYSFNINVVGSQDGDLVRPDILLAMDDLKEHLSLQYEEISAIRSFSDFIKRMNQVIQSDVYAEDETSVAAEEEALLPSFFVEEEPAEAAVLPQREQFYATEDITRFFDATFAILHAAKEPVDEAIYEAVAQLAAELNYKGLTYYEIPSDPAKYAMADAAMLEDLISQYLVLFSGNLSAWINSDFAPLSARMVVQMKTADSKLMRSMSEEIHRFVAHSFPSGYRVEISGAALIEQRLTDIILQSQILSIVVALLAVIAILWISFRSFYVGLLGVIPVLLSLLTNFAVMGWFGITLDISTAMVASCVIGIGIDYAIHYLSAYKDEYLGHPDREKLELDVFRRTGGAIFFNAFSVAGGFLVLAFSQFLPLRNLGILVALNMLVVGFATVTILPTLLDLISPGKIFRVKEGKT